MGIYLLPRREARKPLKVFFLHIPKTAGTTFKELLKRKYPSRRTFTVGGNKAEALKRLKEMSQQTRDKLRLIQGHGILDYHELFSPPHYYITFFRDPVDQVISTFNHRRNAPWNGDHETVKKMASIEEYLDFLYEKGLDNDQTRAISCYPPFSKVNIDKKGDELLERALENLEQKIDAPLLTERFDEGLEFLKRDLAWKSTDYKKKNTGKKRTWVLKKEELNSTEVKEIKKLMKYDLELYKKALEAFEEKLMFYS